MKSLRRVLRYLKPYPARCAWAVLAMLTVAFFNGASVLLLKPIVDKVFIARDFRMLWIAAAAVPVIILLKTAVSYVQNYMMSWLGQKATQEIRSDLFRHLHALPLDYYAQHRTGDILSRVTGDLVIVQNSLNSLPLYLIRDSMTVVFLLGSLFYLDWHFALLSLASVPLISFVLVPLSRKMRDTSLESQAMMARLYQRFEESVLGMPVIRAFNYEEGVLAKFEEENDSFFAPMMSYLRAMALSAPLLELCGAVVAAALLYFGGREVIIGHMTPGAFFAFLGAFFASYAPVKNVARSNSELQRALASAERIFQILDEHPASPLSFPKKGKLAGPPAARGEFAGFAREIRFENVSFRYPGRPEWALREVNFDIPKGAHVAVVGPSGSGKTTLAQLLLRLYEPASGRILFDGRDAREFDPRSLRAAIGLVAQETLLFRDTVFENVALGRSVVTLSEVERACRLAGAEEFVARLPENYHTRLGEDGFTLSPGQRQRLGIARIVMKDPAVLILDEATASLDNSTEAAVLSSLKPLLAGRTVVSITHKLAAVPQADKILVINQGALVETGTHSELFLKEGLYRRLYDLQTSQRGHGRENSVN